MTTKFQIGDGVWFAAFASTETSVQCPECGGTGRLRVTFHDETTVSIECTRCQRGFDPPTGRVPCYDRKGLTEYAVITGVHVESDGVQYDMPGAYHKAEAEIFRSEDEARAAADALAAAYDAAERAKIAVKHNDKRSWAWNASYHRREIKEARRRIEYHESKLAVAAIKAKEAR